MKSKDCRKDYKKTRKDIYIDAEIHRRLKVLAAQENTTLKALIEGNLIEVLEVQKESL